jgi:hypothetical protein
LETAVNQCGNATNLLSIKVTIENHIARVLDGLTAVQRHLEIVLDNLVDAQRRILQPQIIPPDNSRPFPLSKDSTYLLCKICNAQVYIYNHILNYIVELPLINKGDYDILRLIPVPIPLGGGKFVYLDAGSVLLYFDSARQH